MEEGKIDSVDDYISNCHPDVQERLQQLRRVIKEAAPEATEKISWKMPTFVLNGNLVFFAAFKKHIGFYPLPSGIEAFKDELSEYKSSKGSVQFPLNKPLPLELISRMVKARVEENTKQTKERMVKI